MTDRKKVLAIIPARGGSKGLPGKNTKLLGEKPLIAWTIEAALNADCIDKTIVSTDSQNIANIAEKYGALVPFMRPDILATDTATTSDVVEHALTSLDEKFDILVLLQPTSPYRTAEDIDKAYSNYVSSNCSSVVSVMELSKSPSWSYWLSPEKVLKPILPLGEEHNRRQDLAKGYALNGALYICGVKSFMESKSFVYSDTFAYVMNRESSVDIDDEIDFKLAEIMLGAI